MPWCIGDSERSSSHSSSERGVAPVVAHAPGQLADDVLIVSSFTRRGDGGPDPLHSPFGRGDRAFTLGPADRCRQHDVGQLGSASQEDVLDHEQVEAQEKLACVFDVGLGIGRVLADHVRRLDLAPPHRLEHQGQMDAVLGRDRYAVHGLELGSGFGIGDVLEARQLVRQGSHVAAALHVVLAPQRDQPAPPSTDVTGEERQVAERQNVVDGVVVLGDAERPQDLSLLSRGVGLRHLGDGSSRHSGDARSPPRGCTARPMRQTLRNPSCCGR